MSQRSTYSNPCFPDPVDTEMVYRGARNSSCFNKEDRTFTSELFLRRANEQTLSVFIASLCNIDHVNEHIKCKAIATITVGEIRDVGISGDHPLAVQCLDPDDESHAQIVGMPTTHPENPDELVDPHDVALALFLAGELADRCTWAWP